jgi:hypothetical protein
LYNVVLEYSVGRQIDGNEINETLYGSWELWEEHLEHPTTVERNRSNRTNMEEKKRKPSRRRLLMRKNSKVDQITYVNGTFSRNSGKTSRITSTCSATWWSETTEPSYSLCSVRLFD